MVALSYLACLQLNVNEDLEHLKWLINSPGQYININIPKISTITSSRTADFLPIFGSLMKNDLVSCSGNWWFRSEILRWEWWCANKRSESHHIIFVYDFFLPFSRSSQALFLGLVIWPIASGFPSLPSLSRGMYPESLPWTLKSFIIIN